MAVSGRQLYTVILPFILSVATVFLLFGIRLDFFQALLATASERRFLEYQQRAYARVGPGEQGEGFLPPGSGIGAGDVVNLRASDDIAVDRAIKDYRHRSCKEVSYKGRLPKATVIITYTKEEFSLLLRTLHSVVNRTPPKYLQQVLVLTYGNVTDVKDLDKYAKATWTEDLVEVIYPDGLDNLYDARMRGANISNGEVLVFLNSHCEVADGWLEPLLNAILKNPFSVAVPVLDDIDPTTLSHIPKDTEQTGGFYFNLTMAWRPLSQQEKEQRLTDPLQPIKTAVISGEAFAVAAAYLKSLGDFQPLMYTRGLELEFSFRVWMCGGKMEIHPCSRVAHLAHARNDYDNLGEEREDKAMIQLAEVWMDEYRRLFYMYRKSILSKDYGGDFAQEHLLQRRKKCRGFGWYLDTVYTDRFLPDENVYSWGVVRNPNNGKCLSTGKSWIKADVYQTVCDHSGNTDQTFSYTFDKTIRQEESRCLSSDGIRGHPLTIVDCRANNVSTIWEYNKEDCVIFHQQSGLCLTAGDKRSHNLTLERCEDQAKNQFWTFLYYLDV